MQQNMNSASQKSLADPRKNTGNLKRDINLLPANENSEKIARAGLIGIALAACLLALAYVAIIMPNAQLKEKQDMAADLASQAAQKAALSAQFDTRKAERDTYLVILSQLEASKANPQSSDLMGLISKACPDGVTLVYVSLADTGALINGRAPDDGAVAQLIANLESLGLYRGGVQLKNGQDSDNKGDVNQKRFFQISAAYLPATTQTPEPTAAPTETKEGGEEK